MPSTNPGQETPKRCQTCVLKLSNPRGWSGQVRQYWTACARQVRRGRPSSARRGCMAAHRNRADTKTGQTHRSAPTRRIVVVMIGRKIFMVACGRKIFRPNMYHAGITSSHQRHNVGAALRGRPSSARRGCMAAHRNRADTKTGQTHRSAPTRRVVVVMIGRKIFVVA